MEVSKYEYFAKQVFKSALEVHKTMGPGLLESVYEECLLLELRERGVNAKSQVELPLTYKGHPIQKNFRVDILVENELIIEVKAVEKQLLVHDAQIISYLKIADKRMGFLINFNVRLLKNGFKRFVNEYEGDWD